MRITFVSAVPAMLGAVAWGVWDAHVRTLREIAGEPWDPPAHVWSRADPPTVAVEPGGEVLWAEVQEQGSLCGHDDREPETIVVGPTARADARRSLGIVGRDNPAYEVSGVRRAVAGVTWLRWDLDPRSR